MKKLVKMSTLLLILLICGCSWSFNTDIAGEAFWPDVRTKEGGGFGDPDKSRHEVMRPYKGSTRNNEGGNKTDKALRAFFDTSPRTTEKK